LIFAINLQAEEPEEYKGFVTFSLTNGPEFHVSQVFGTT